MKCSRCGTEISAQYCPNCGQQYRSGRVSIKGVLVDYFNSFFSIEKSLLLDYRDLLIRPRKYVENYWNGFRKGQSSPNRILTVAGFVFGLALYFNDGFFFGLEFSLSNFNVVIFIFLLFVPSLSLSSFLAFLGDKRNFAEHMVLGTYVFGFWITIYSVLWLAIASVSFTELNNALLLLFITLIFVSLARVLHNSWISTIMRALLMVVLLGALLAGIVFALQAST